MTDWDERLTLNGETLTRRVWALIEDAAAAAGIPPGIVTVTQGSWSDGGLSGGTHSGGGAMDIRVWNLPGGKAIPLVVELRKRNCCAWLRDPQHGPWFGGAHIHAVVRDEPGLSTAARQQVSLYDRGLNGLANGGRDYHPRPEQLHYDPEESMPLTQEDIEKIAEAVWQRTMVADGQKRKMGAMLGAVYEEAKKP